MTFFTKRQALGLDIGQAAAKAVLLERSARGVTVLASASFDSRGEGIIGEAELCAEVVAWLGKQGWQKKEVVVGVPQYLASTQVSDFPPSGGKTLGEMVRFETQHLAGLSDESFIYDHRPMPARFGRQNPVLIGFCRESVVRERADALLDAGVNVADFAMTATAIAGAYFHLHPEAFESDTPQLLLDLGAETTTVAVVAGGNVLYTAALAVGVDRLAAAAAPPGGAVPDAPRQPAAEAGGGPGGRGVPAGVAASLLERELRNALETWRSEERPEIGRKQFSKVILSGGGAHLAGLDASLARAFACPAEVLGAADGPGRPPEPRLLTAYGLALHGLGLSQAGISLSTQRVRVQRHRRARFPFLAAAAALLVIFAGLLEVSAYRNLTERQATVNRELEHLRNCNRIVPDLEASQQDIEFHQRVLIPFVEKGNHAQRFLRSVAKLQRAKERMLGESGHPEGWVIYVADERSFHAGKPKADGAGAGRGAGSGFDPFSGAATAGGGVTAAAGDPFPNRVVVTDLEPVRSMVAAVYTTHDAKEPYRLIKSLVAALNPPDPAATPPGKENPPADPDADLLAGVDLMPESESAGREDVFLPWVEYFKRHEPSDKPAGFRRFVLRLPFASVDIQEPPAAGGAPK